jgi:hypothetical protein
MDEMDEMDDANARNGDAVGSATEDAARPIRGLVLALAAAIDADRALADAAARRALRRMPGRGT